MSTPSMFFMTAFSMSAALSTSMRFTPGGVAMLTGPQTMVTSAPASRAAAATAKSHLPGAAIADEAHGIDSFTRRPGGEQHALAGERTAWREGVRDMCGQLRRLEHAAGSHFTAGLVALARSPDMYAARLQRGDIGLRRGIRPHHAIHRGRERDGRSGGETQRRQQIVRLAGS